MKFFILLFHLISLIGFIQPQASVYSTDFDALTYRTVRQKMGYQTVTPSIGQVNMLVIPISFSDFSCHDLPSGCIKTREDIEVAFFGEAETTTWQSVASFYRESSLNQLQFSGVVTPWYTPSMTAIQLTQNPSGGLAGNVMQPAVQWFKQTYPELVPLFDQDQDGFLDAVYLIYSIPSQPEDERLSEGKDLFWAFTSYVGGTANRQDPQVFHFCWSSYDFMYMDGYYERDEQGRLLRHPLTDEPIFHPWVDENNQLQVDAHVYIHEVGHLLGLFDYYTYDADQGDWGPLGNVDMMDYNVGDHNPYTKAILGWQEPMVVSEPTTITLAPFSTSGQSILLTPQFQNTLMDEYLLIEFYTPEGLFEADSIDAFAGRYPKTFTIPGIRIYHVDSRVGSYTYSQGKKVFQGFVTNIPSNSSLAYDIAHSNSASRSLNPNHRLIHLLESSGENSFKHQGYAINETLFQVGDHFNENVFSSFTFNSGLPLGMSIEIQSLTNQEATIQIHA